MKKLISYFLVCLTANAFSQSVPGPIQKLNVTSEAVYFKGTDETILTKYYVTGSFEWTNPDYVINATLDITLPKAGAPDTLLKTLHITNNPDSFIPFNATTSGFFIEQNKVYFFLSPLTDLEGIKFSYKAIGGTGSNPPVIQQACQRLPPIKLVVSPANPN